jgi:hypothetical protein
MEEKTRRQYQQQVGPLVERPRSRPPPKNPRPDIPGYDSTVKNVFDSILDSVVNDPERWDDQG